MQENKAATTGHDKDKGFALLRTDTIQLWVWLQGYQPLDEQPLKSISEDISYRIRESSDCAVNFMRHCKRTKLKTSDLKQAFQQCNIERNFGNVNTYPLKYKIINTSDSSEKILKCFRTKLFQLEDDVNELKLSDDPFEAELNTSAEKLVSEKSIHGKWILVNGNSTHIESKDLLETTDFSLEDIDISNQSEFDIESDLFYASILDDAYKKYYDMITGIVLLQDCSDENGSELFDRVLESLRTDLKLQPLLPYLINFLSRTIQSLTLLSNNETSYTSKTNIFFLQRCIQTLKNLILNKNNFLAPRGFFLRILSALLYSTLQNTTFTNDVEGLVLRENSSYTMILFLRLYQRFSTATIQYLINKIFMPHLIEKSDSNLFTTYGIIASLIHFGGQIIDTFYQRILEFAKKLEARDASRQYADIHIHVQQIILKCLIIYYKWFLKKISLSKKKNPYFSWRNLYKIYKEIEEVYGAAFTNQIIDGSVVETCRTFTKKKSKHCESDDQILLDKKKIIFRELKQSGEVEQVKKTYEEAFENEADNKKSFVKQGKSLIKINYGTRRLVLENSSNSLNKNNVSLNEKSSCIKQNPIVVGVQRHRTAQVLVVDLLRVFI